jgi:hypothetical protein
MPRSSTARLVVAEGPVNAASQLPQDVRALIVRQLAKALVAEWRRQHESESDRRTDSGFGPRTARRGA